MDYIEKKAIDIVPYFNKLVYLNDKDEEASMEIVYRRWATDGKEIIFGLDNHCSFFAKPNELVTVIEITPRHDKTAFLEKDRKEMENRPFGKCKGHGFAKCI